MIEERKVNRNASFSVKKETFIHKSNEEMEDKVITSQLFVEGWKINGSSLFCSEKKLLTILVISAPNHLEERQAIRMSWGGIAKSRADITFAFLIGLTMDDAISREIAKEESEFSDIIVYNMTDGYESLSLKTLSGLKWVEKFCPENSYLLKIDDDMFLQIPRLLGFLRGQERRGNGEPFIFGKIAQGWKPVHNKKSKYYIRPSAYTEEYYPTFVTGPSYLLSRLAIQKILKTAMTLPYIHLEDVFITGVVAEKAHIKRKEVQEFRNNATPVPPKFIGCTLLRTITVHKVKPKEQSEYLKMSQKPVCGPNMNVEKIPSQKAT